MLQRLFIFLLIFLILPDIYLYLRFIVHLTAKRWLRILYWLPAFLLSTGLLYLVYFSNNAFAERHTQAIGWFSIFFFLLASLSDSVVELIQSIVVLIKFSLNF